MTLKFGKYKGWPIEQVPRSYLDWWKDKLSEDLRACGGETRRRESFGLTQDLERLLDALPEHKRYELVRRLESARSTEEKEYAVWLIHQKHSEYAWRAEQPACDETADYAELSDDEQ